MTFVFKLLALALILTAGLSSVNADARQGEFFGYRLGDRYPLTWHTRTGMSGPWRYVEAERAIKPPTISEVSILTTPKSLQIVAITGHRSFSDRAQAWRFFNVMSSMLASHYRFSWRDSRTQSGGKCAVLGAQYRIALWVKPRWTGGATVFVSLIKRSASDLAALARRELRREVLRPQAQPLLARLLMRNRAVRR